MDAFERVKVFERRDKIYRAITFLEEYLREIIYRTLKEKHGGRWREILEKVYEERYKEKEEVSRRTHFWVAFDDIQTRKGCSYFHLPGIEDLKNIIISQWDVFSPSFEGLKKEEVDKTLESLLKLRRKSHHVSPYISEKEVGRTVSLIKKLIVDDEKREEFERFLIGEGLTEEIIFYPHQINEEDEGEHECAVCHSKEHWLFYFVECGPPLSAELARILGVDPYYEVVEICNTCMDDACSVCPYYDECIEEYPRYCKFPELWISNIRYLKRENKG